jgi:hypothetical protein
MRGLYRAGLASEGYEEWWDSDEPVFWDEHDEAFYGDREQGLHRLCGKLWNCTDTMPSGLCEDRRIVAAVASVASHGRRSLRGLSP